MPQLIIAVGALAALLGVAWFASGGIIPGISLSARIGDDEEIFEADGTYVFTPDDGLHPLKVQRNRWATVTSETCDGVDPRETAFGELSGQRGEGLTVLGRGGFAEEPKDELKVLPDDEFVRGLSQSARKKVSEQSDVPSPGVETEVCRKTSAGATRPTEQPEEAML